MEVLIYLKLELNLERVLLIWLSSHVEFQFPCLLPSQNKGRRSVCFANIKRNELLFHQKFNCLFAERMEYKIFLYLI